MNDERKQRREDLLRFLRTLQKPGKSVERLGDDESLVASGLIYGSATMTLEQMIKQYTGPKGGFISRNGSPYMAVADGPFITARTTPDGYPAALLALAQLHGGGQLPAEYVIDADGRGHEPSAAEVRRIGA